MALKSITDDSFAQDVLGSDKPVLVDFWAAWCGPCRQLARSLEAIAAEHGDKIEIVKLNIDENPDTAMRYGVMSIPTMNVYKDGEYRPSSAPSRRPRWNGNWPTSSPETRTRCALPGTDVFATPCRAVPRSRSWPFVPERLGTSICRSRISAVQDGAARRLLLPTLPPLDPESTLVKVVGTLYRQQAKSS